MPTYVYKFVETGETIEVQQAFSDATLTEVAHPESGEVMAVKKVFTPVGVTFKGSGFFKTDNRGKKSTTEPASSKDAAKTDSSSKDGGTSSSESSSGDSSSKSSSSSSDGASKAPTSKPSSTSKSSTPTP